MQRVTQMVTMVVALCTITQAQFTTEHRALQETKSVRSFEQDRTRDFVPTKSRGAFTEKLDSVLNLDPSNPSVISYKDFYTYDANGRVLSERTHYTPGVEYKVEYSYDNTGNKLSSTTSRLENNLWIDTQKDEYTYSSIGMSSTSYYYDTLQDVWIVGSKRESLYDDVGNTISFTDLFWHVDTWIPSDSVAKTYTSQGALLTSISMSWDNGAWVNSSKFEKTYDAEGNKLSVTFSDWSNGVWEEDSKDEYTYDNRGNILTHIIFDKESSVLMEPNRKMVYTYNTSNSRLSLLFYTWASDSIDWILKDSVAYSYDLKGNRTGEVDFEWLDGAWNEYSRFVFTVDASVPTSSIAMTKDLFEEFNDVQVYAKMTEFISSDWDSTVDSWVPDYHQQYFYSSLTSPIAPQIKGATSPFSATVVGNKIRFSSPLPAGAQVQIHTLAGRTIHTASVVGTSYNLPPLSSGVYFVTVKAQQQKHQFKMSVQ